MSIRLIDNLEQGGVGLSSLDKIAPIASIASSGLGMVGNAINQTKLMDTGSLDDVIDSYSQYRPQYTTNDQVLGDYNNFSFIDHVSKRQLMGNSPLEAVGGSILQGGQGAMAGLAGATALGAAGLSTVAPGVGTLVGAGLGLLTGGISSFAKKRKARRKARRLNRKIDDANQNAMDRMQQGMQNVNVNMGLDSLSNFYSRGGMLGQSSRPTLKETVAKNLKDKYIVQQGDSMGKISQELGYDTDRIIQSNPDITNPSLIYPGLEIKLPLKTIQELIDGSLYRLKEFADTLQEKVLTTMMTNKYEDGGMINRNFFAEGGNIDNFKLPNDNINIHLPFINNVLNKDITLKNKKKIKDLELLKVLSNQPLLSSFDKADEVISLNIKNKKNNDAFLLNNQHLYSLDPTKISNNTQEASFNYNNNKNLLTSSVESGGIFGGLVANPIATTLGIIGGYIGGELGNNVSKKITSDKNLLNVSTLLGGIAGGGIGYARGNKSNINKIINKNRNINKVVNEIGSNIDKSKVDNSYLSKPKDKKIIFNNNNPNNASTYRTDLRNKKSNIDIYEKAGISKHDRTNKIKTNPIKGNTELDDLYLINRGDELYDFSKGDMVWKTDKTRKTSHFTLDEPVKGHNSGNWDHKSETLITPYKLMVEDNGLPSNYDIMDTWFANPNNIKVGRKGSKILTSNIDNYKKYKSQGIDVTFSKESSKILNKVKKIDLELEKLKKQNPTDDFGNFLDSELNFKMNELESNKSKLLEQNRDAINSWIKKNKANLNDDLLLNYAKEGGIEEEILKNKKYFSETGERYQRSPTTHSSNWTFDAEGDIHFKNNFDPENSIIKYYNTYGEKYIKELDLPILLRYIMDNPNDYSKFKVNAKGKKGDIINRLLLGEKIYKLALGGNLNNNNMININRFDEGGILENPSNTNGGVFSNGITRVESGGTHEENPNGGVMHSLDQDGTPNMVEEGEVIYKDFVFSNKLVLEEEDQMNSNLPDKFIGMTFAEIAEELQEESSERPFDPISINGLEENMMDLFISQETKKQIQEEDERFINSLIGMDGEEEMEEPMEDAYMDEMPEENFEMMGQEEMYEDPSVGLQDLMGGI